MLYVHSLFILSMTRTCIQKYRTSIQRESKEGQGEREKEIKEQQAKVRRSNQSRLLKAIEIRNDLVFYGFHLLADVSEASMIGIYHSVNG